MDSRTLPGWRYDEEEHRAVGKIVTIGFVTQSNNEALAVSCSISSEGASLNDTAIPWGTMHSITLLGKEFDR